MPCRTPLPPAPSAPLPRFARMSGDPQSPAFHLWPPISLPPPQIASRRAANLLALFVVVLSPLFLRPLLLNRQDMQLYLSCPPTPSSWQGFLHEESVLLHSP